MARAIVSATLKSVIITLLSCIIGKYFFKPDDPPHFLSLILYSALATPPNFLWQQRLEKMFPGYTLTKLKVDDGGKGVEVEKKLDITNTIIKVCLDQSVAAVANVVGYLGITRFLRGVPLSLCINAVKEQTWPVMLAGYKLWPAVNVIQHVFIPVEQKIVVGSLVGLGWNTYLALTASR